MEDAELLVQRLKRLELIHAVSRELNNSLQAESLLPRVLALVLSTLKAEAGSIWLLKGDKIICEHAHGGAGESIVGLELPRGAGVVGSVAEKRKPEIVLDVAQDRRHVQQVDDATGFVARSMITVPLLVQGECLGSLQILNKIGEGARFSKEDAEVAQEIALDAAATVRNSRLMLVERSAKEMRALLKMSREITSTLDLDRILLTAANILSGTVGFDRCTIALERQGALEVVAVSGKEKVDREDPGVKAVADLLGWLRGFGTTIYSSGPEHFAEEDEAKAARFRAHAEGAGMKAVLAVPLKDDSGAIGMLSMESAKEDFLEEGQQELVETFANQVAVAMRNADLYRQTPMVGIFQRRAAGSGIGGSGGGAGGLWADKRVRRAAVGAGALLVLCLIPIPWWASGDAEVHPARRHHIRTDSAIVVDRIDVEEGQAVEAGQVLGELRSQERAQDVAQLEGKVRHSRADAARLEGAGRTADARAARDQAGVYESQLSMAQLRLEACTLRSPVKGWVLTRRPRELVGTTAAAGGTVLEVAEGGRWVVEIQVPQESIPAAKAGQAVTFSTPAAPGRRFQGKAVAVGVVAVSSEAGVAFPVTGEVDDPGGVLRVGMRGHGSVRLGGRFLGGKLFGGFFRWVRWKVGF